MMALEIPHACLRCSFNMQRSIATNSPAPRARAAAAHSQLPPASIQRVRRYGSRSQLFQELLPIGEKYQQCLFFRPTVWIQARDNSFRRALPSHSDLPELFDNQRISYIEKRRSLAEISWKKGPPPLSFWRKRVIRLWDLSWRIYAMIFRQQKFRSNKFTARAQSPASTPREISNSLRRCLR